jgi:hypothetical protein
MSKPPPAKLFAQTVKGTSKTFFVDVIAGKDGAPYLQLAESRKKKDCDEFERQTVTIFPDNFAEILSALEAARPHLVSD